jgi:hypothetical protein
MRSRIAPLLACAVAIALVGMPLAGCGSSDEGESRPAPAASEFPAAKGRTLTQLAQLPEAKLVVAPAGQVVDVGVNRLAFGVFDLGGEQVDDADIALYFAHGPDGPAQGPFPARVESLKTPAAFRAKTTSEDPGAATSVYVVPDLKIKQRGELAMLAVVRRDGKLEATRPPSLVAGKFEDIPGVGDMAPRIHTPTVGEVADISEIDTRIPPDSMHDVDFADVLGKKPILLVFATPQLCQTRVCGPVVDIEEEVKSRVGDQAAFIHMEVYNDNEIPKGVRPQLRAFNLETEPWAFVVGRDGRVTARFEGAFGAEELTQAVEAAIEQPAS